MNLDLDRSHWERVRFGDVVRNVNEYFNADRDGVLPYVAGPHIRAAELKPSFGSTDDVDFPPTFKRRFIDQDVLLHSRGIEKLAVVDRPGVTGEKLFVLRSRDTERLVQRFLPFLILSPVAQRHMAENFTGSVNKFLNWGPLAEFEFDLPPLDEQRRIADLLWTVQASRSANAETAREFDRLLHMHTDQFMEEALAECSAPLVDQLESSTVGIVVRPTQYYTDSLEGVPALRGLNVKPNGFDLDELVRFRPDDHAKLTKSTLRKGDVVVVRTGRPGDSAVVDDSTAGFNCIDLIVVRPKVTVEARYLSRFLNSSVGRGAVGAGAAGTAQQHFNVGALKRLQFPLIDRTKQEQFVTGVERLERARQFIEQERAELIAMQSSLVSAVFGDVA